MSSGQVIGRKLLRRDFGAGDRVVTGGATEGPAVGKPTVSGQEECQFCERPFRVDEIRPVSDGPEGPDSHAIGRQMCTDTERNHHYGYGGRCWAWTKGSDSAPAAKTPWPDERRWLEALDEAIATVTWREYMQLRERRPIGFTKRLERAFESIERLQGRQQPDYDNWDAPFYVSWYQPRQVHLVFAVLDQYRPPPSRKALQIVDLGCGAWAAPIAIAMLAARGHPALSRRKVSIHGIEPQDPMTQVGKELWLEFRVAAEDRGLDTDFFDPMINDDGIFTSGETYLDELVSDASADSWLLAIHALYDKSRSHIGRFLDRYRERLASGLRYELVTTDGSKHKLEILERVVGEIARNRPRPKPIWKDPLPKTRECRLRIGEALKKELEDSGSPIGDRWNKWMNYLRGNVTWNLGKNPIEQDAVWVRGAVQ